MLLVSNDSKYLFSTNGSRIDVFSIASGELVYRLSYNENNDPTTKSSKKSKVFQNESIIKSICINTKNKYQLLSFHIGGRICLWDYEDGLLLKTFETNLIIKKLVRTEANLYVLGKLRNDLMDKTSNNKELIDGNNNQHQLCLYRLLIDDGLRNQSHIEHQLVVSGLTLNEEKMLVDIDGEAKYLAYVESRKYLVVNQFKKNSTSVLNKYKAKLELTSLAIHPNEDCIATGTQSGKIILWYNYLQSPDASELTGQRQHATKSVLHWHSLPVLSLRFTPEGSYLLSGGHECVLVKWMFKSGQTEFKPRLGAPLSDIVLSKDNTLYVSQHTDNTIHIIGTNMTVQQTFCGFLSPGLGQKSLKSTETLYHTGLNYFQKLNCLVTNGKPGHLQFYSYSSDKLLFNLDIVEENYISPENLNRPNIHTEIECLAVNHDSSWLVTCERRNDQVTTPESRLKFWRFDQATNKFVLNTFVRFPHAFEQVNKIKFKQNENVLFTCGNDNCFKSWVLRENEMHASSDKDEPTFNWVYNSCDGYRDLNPTHIDFVTLEGGVDLVAVSFDHITTIWHYDQYGVIFLSDLIHCDPEDLIRDIQFLGNKLLVSHANCLNVWNLELPKKTSELDMALIEDIKFSCLWSQDISEVLYVTKNPVDPTELILFVKKSQKQVNEDTLTEVQIASFSMLKESEPAFKIIYTFNAYCDSRLHFVCIQKSESEVRSLGTDKGISEIEKLLTRINIFYCDNRGILQKVLSKKNSSVNNEEHFDFIDTDLDDSMWKNRSALKKNLPESNLASIIDLHKSNKYGENNQFIQSEKNPLFEENLSKIETTPAYLLPKVSTFCFDFLKSMLHRYESEGVSLVKKALTKKADSVMQSEESTDGSDEEMDMDAEGEENTSKSLNHVNASKEVLI